MGVNEDWLPYGRGYALWGRKLDIVLFGMVGLIAALAFSAWTCGRSYFLKGKIRGLEEAVRELQAGMASQLGAQLAPDVQKALTNFSNCLGRYSGRRAHGTDPIHAHLW